MKKELLDKLDKLSEDLPPNTLDELIDELGGPENVAEVNPGWEGARGCRCQRSSSWLALRNGPFPLLSWVPTSSMWHSVPQMTGRKGRVVSNDDGRISYESRSELDVPVEILNITEKQRFMDGDKVSFHFYSCLSCMDSAGLGYSW